MRTVHTDCRYYIGERPCNPHKKYGTICESCDHYDPIKTRIIIIKLGATGDVLRTTSILKSVIELYPNSHITWICGTKSYPLIHYNSFIDRPLQLDEETLLLLDHESFDVCINFDLSPVATALDARIHAAIHKGFGRKPDGSYFAYEEAGNTWLEMSLWDDKKKENQLTYQEHMKRIIGSFGDTHPIIVPLVPNMEEKAMQFAAIHQLHEYRILIGFNIGAGERWQHKKWTIEGFVELAERIYHELNVKIILLYGPADYQRAKAVKLAMSVPYIDAGLHENMLEFIAFLNLCDIVVTGDTFALHAALGLGKRVICLVGPTSAPELELYGQGIVLQGDIDCLGCYLTRCDKKPFCMQLLKSETVFQSVQLQLQQL